MAGFISLDSNVYIQSLRDMESRIRFKRLLLRAGVRLRVNAVVALELRAGARSPAGERAVEELIEPYAQRGRVIVPSFEAYVQAGRVLASLGMRDRVSTSPSFTNDVVIASSCREADALLVTSNHRDFSIIQRHLRGFRFTDLDRLLM